MKKILENRFFEFCGETFKKDLFLKNLYSQKDKGLRRVVNSNGLILEDSYFGETLCLLNDLIHGQKFYSDQNYNKNSKKERKHVHKRYTATNAKTVFSKFPYLNDLNFLIELRRIFFEEVVIQEVYDQTYVSPKIKKIEFQDENFFISFLSSLENPNKIELSYICGAYVLQKSEDDIVCLIHKNIADYYRKMNVLKSNKSYSLFNKEHHPSLTTDNNFKEKLEEIKKKNLREKLNTL